MSTLAVVEEILRETGVPMSVRQIVEQSAGRLPTRSRTPDTVVARDLSMDIKRQGTSSKFERVSPGRYAMRGAARVAAPAAAAPSLPDATTPIVAAALPRERAAALPADGSKQSAVKPAAKPGKSATATSA